MYMGWFLLLLAGDVWGSSQREDDNGIEERACVVVFHLDFVSCSIVAADFLIKCTL